MAGNVREWKSGRTYKPNLMTKELHIYKNGKLVAIQGATSYTDAEIETAITLQEILGRIVKINEKQGKDRCLKLLIKTRT